MIAPGLIAQFSVRGRSRMKRGRTLKENVDAVSPRPL